MWDSLKWIPGLASGPERAAMRAFRADQAGAFPARVSTVADEPTRFVVRIVFGPNRTPNFYRFYAVDKTTLVAELILDDSDYPPSNRLKLR